MVNATPMGMSPHEDSSPWPAQLRLPEGAFIYDLVYNPPVTRLMRQASSEGLQTAPGLGMLVEQGALGFQLWTGIEPPRAVMYATAQKIMERSDA